MKNIIKIPLVSLAVSAGLFVPSIGLHHSSRNDYDLAREQLTQEMRDFETDQYTAQYFTRMQEKYLSELAVQELTACNNRITRFREKGLGETYIEAKNQQTKYKRSARGKDFISFMSGIFGLVGSVCSLGRLLAGLGELRDEKKRARVLQKRS